MTQRSTKLNSFQKQRVLDALLAAHKDGRLQDLMNRHPRIAAALASRWLVVVIGTAGDALPVENRVIQATGLLLRWGATQLRPDQLPSLTGIDQQAWLYRTSWRPVLTLACHYGFIEVPPFRDRYRARDDEAVVDVLCALWSVGPSTVYRYLHKGKRQLLETLTSPPTGSLAASLRHMVQREISGQLRFESSDGECAWHRRQAMHASTIGDTMSAMWHDLKAKDAASFLSRLQRATVALANDREIDGLCDMLATEASVTPRQSFDLCLARSALWRIRQNDECEREALEHALRMANKYDAPLLLGIAYAALGKFHEPRDADRAFACYEDSAEHLRRAERSDSDGAAAEVKVEYTSTLVQLAWLYVLRNDPRSRTVLDRAQQLCEEREVRLQVKATLEQTWGEYWRRAGELRRALEHKHRALNLYERIGDQRSVLITYLNLSPIYGQLKDFERAVDYAQRVISVSATVSLEPEMLCSVRLNLGATYFWQSRYDQAIEQYQVALDLSRSARLKLHLWRAHYNLAEAYYKRFQLTQNSADEQQGDAHSVAAVAVDTDPLRVEATRKLKTEVLGNSVGANPDRLLPQEFSAHFDEMVDIQRQRAVLAIPVEPRAHVRAHLAIARTYVAIASKERDAALGLIQKHNLDAQFAADFEALSNTFYRDLTHEERLATLWGVEARDLLSSERRAAVLAALFRVGSINKSQYAQACGLALSTASKHLVTLAERGLLSQSGKGPSTRYATPPIEDKRYRPPHSERSSELTSMS